MAERAAQSAQKAEDDFGTYVRQVSSEGAADQIAKAKQLLDSNAITQEEFEPLKAKALG